jgi:hypothetical protein
MCGSKRQVCSAFYIIQSYSRSGAVALYVVAHRRGDAYFPDGQRIWNKNAPSLFPTAGVMACVVYGLYGAATVQWHMSIQSKRTRAMEHFWDAVVYQLNAVLFFFVGASSCNFLVRYGNSG